MTTPFRLSTLPIRLVWERRRAVLRVPGSRSLAAFSTGESRFDRSRAPKPMRFACLCLLALSMCGRSQANIACPPPPCCVGTEAGRRQCASSADWIIEGTVVSVESGTDRQATSRGTEAVPVGAWNIGTVELADATISKGTFRVAGGKASLHGASQCWLEETRVPAQSLGKRIRGYGLSGEKGLPICVSPGVFAVELVPERVVPPPIVWEDLAPPQTLLRP
jgi:hypothetical protein